MSNSIVSHSALNASGTIGDAPIHFGICIIHHCPSRHCWADGCFSRYCTDTACDGSEWADPIIIE